MIRRRLVAVMFTDIVGYTALMQQDESRAVALRRRSEEVLRAAIESHQGELLQTYGDGTLSIFPSAVLSVRAAYEVQRELQSEPVVNLRIGLHLGDILLSDDGVYGDGVNIASRIESSGIAGSVLLSEKVADELSNHPDLVLAPLGNFEFKNVGDSISLFALDQQPLIVPAPGDILAKMHGNTNESIAVLPFVNLSSDPDNEFFSDGITEELLNVLARMPELRVIARTSSFAYKGRNVDVRTVGRELGVRHILEGSVRKAGDRVRITAQLIDAADGYHLWSDNFDGKLENVFDLQDEISRKIAKHLRVLFGKESAAPSPEAERPGLKPEAYEHYLRARYLANRWMEKDSREALKQYEAALEIEPEYALAFAGLSEVWAQMGAMGQHDPKESFEKARSFAYRALSFDPELPQAHIALGWVHYWWDWDWTRVVSDMKTVLDRNPNFSAAWQYLAMTWILRGDLDEALDSIRHSLELDPHSITANYCLGTIHYFREEFDEAISTHEHVLELEPKFVEAHGQMAWAYHLKGDSQTALRIFGELVSSETTIGNQSHAYQAIIKATMGDEKPARKILHEWSSKYGFDLSIKGFAIPVLNLVIGETDAAFEQLEKVIEAHIPNVIFVGSDPCWRPYQEDPRMQRLLNKIGAKATPAAKR